MGFIHFFGTTGSKNVFFKKIRSAGGLYLSVDNTNIIIDPGVNTFFKYSHTYKDKLDGIILSHVHIDHANDLNIFVELMTEGGKERKGTILLPRQAIENKVLQPYLNSFPEKIYLSESQKKYTIKNIEIQTSIKHEHGVENYGFVIKTKKNNIGIVTDTKYFSELLLSYQNCDILIMNVPYSLNKNPNIKHLDIPAVEEFIKAISPQKVILTHFNNHILEKNPSLIAKGLSEKYKIEVIAAQDDMILTL